MMIELAVTTHGGGREGGEGQLGREGKGVGHATTVFALMRSLVEKRCIYLQGDPLQNPRVVGADHMCAHSQLSILYHAI